MTDRNNMTKQERKERPLARGVLDYFPDALLEVANLSFVGNEQHNPGQPMHWAKGKSTDEADALMRHMLDRGTRDTDGVRHSAKVAWRALAMLQREIEAERNYLVSEKRESQETSPKPNSILYVDEAELTDLAFRDTPWASAVGAPYAPPEPWGPHSSVLRKPKPA